ncbi:MAG: formylglycine-generating enzyme family protein [Gammaproteobacteria bacterium]
MSTPILRGLAKAYSDGLIDRKHYIRGRRHLIDDIVAGDVEIVPYDAPKPPADPAVERTFSDGEATLEMPRVDLEAATQPLAPAKSGRSGLIIVVVVIVAATAYAGWRAISPNPEGPAATMAVTSVPEGPNPAGVLLESFLEENTWLLKRIEGFTLAWEQEPQTARDALIDTPTMRRAADLITRQILEEKALFELGEQDTALRKQRRLLDLAATLSIENERISRQETEWHMRQNALLAAQAPGITPDGSEPAVSPAADPAIGPTADTDEDNAAATFTDPQPPPEPEPNANTPRSIEIAEVAERTTVIATSPVVELPMAESPVVEAPVNAVVAAAGEASPAVVTPSAPEPPAAASSTQAPAGKSSTKRKGCRAALAKQRRPYCRDSLGNNLNGPTLVVLPAGKAEIGGSKAAEQPKYTVDIKRPFGLGVFEVSNAEFNAFCQATKQNCPAQPWSDPDFPVVNISWSLATKYTQWLSDMSGASYRLPTESEWEYAARAGTRSPYPFGDEVLPTHARFSFRGQDSTPVAANDRTVNRNKFRLYHMIGNVREWVLDAWHDNHSGAAADGSARVGNTTARVARGGSYSDGADQVRSASRVRIDGDGGDAQTGFRVLREIE